MPMPTLVNLPSLIDDAKCFELVRQHRWPEGVRCPSCRSASVARHGRDDTQPHRRKRPCRCAADGGGDPVLAWPFRGERHLEHPFLHRFHRQLPAGAVRSTAQQPGGGKMCPTSS